LFKENEKEETVMAKTKITVISGIVLCVVVASVVSIVIYTGYTDKKLEIESKRIMSYLHIGDPEFFTLGNAVLFLEILTGRLDKISDITCRVPIQNTSTDTKIDITNYYVQIQVEEKIIMQTEGKDFHLDPGVKYEVKLPFIHKDSGDALIGFVRNIDKKYGGEVKIIYRTLATVNIDRTRSKREIIEEVKYEMIDGDGLNIHFYWETG